jgi:FkbM family methyltransferase
MERTIKIFDRPVTIADRDESRYLSTMAESFEPDVLSIFATFCGRRSNALDVGANIGMTAIALGRLCSKGKVLAVEASPDTFLYLKANVAQAGLSNVTCVNMAASSVAGRLEISVHPSFSAGAFITNKYPADFQGMLHHTVPARTIDEVVDTAGMSRVNFMKIDVEGFELEVIRGAQQTIKRCKPVIFCEVNHWCLNVLQRIALPDFIDEMRANFPHLFAVHADGSYIDLSNKGSLHHFYHQHVVTMAYMNLLCGFDKHLLVKRLESRSAAASRNRWNVRGLARSCRNAGRRLLRSA